MTTSPPGAVRRAHLLWLLAVTAGTYETGLAIAHGFAVHDLTVPQLFVQLAVRAFVLGGAVVAAQRMREGSGFARGTLGVGGTLGLAALLVGPVVWLFHGHVPADVDLAPLEWVLATSQLLLAAAMVAAISSMYSASSHAWFAERSGGATSAAADMIGAVR